MLEWGSHLLSIHYFYSHLGPPGKKMKFLSSILLDTSRIFTYKEQSRPQLSYLASVYIIALPDWFSPERIKTNLIGQYFTRVTSVTC